MAFYLLDDLSAEIRAEIKKKDDLFFIWPERGIFGYDPETGCRVKVSRGKTKYAREYLKCWVESPISDVDGYSLGYSTVFQFKSDFIGGERKAKWLLAIEKANELFPRKYEKFVKERAEYLRMKKAGELPEAKSSLTMWTPYGYVYNGVPVRKRTVL